MTANAESVTKECKILHAYYKFQWESGVNVLQKKSFINGGYERDKIRFNWFTKARSQNISISGPIVKAKADEVALKLGVSNYVASKG